MWFIAAVYKKKKLLSEDAVEMESTETFSDLLFEILGYDIFDQPIVIQFYNELTKNWTNVKYGLSANLSLCKKFQPCQIKFTLKEQENLEKEDRQKVNGLCEIMKASRILRLPKERNFVTRYDLLYNDLVKLLKVESLGWYGEHYESTGSGFIKALADLLWYVDPHHEKLKLRCCVIPEIFLSLSQYKIKSSYNLFYYAGKHKKEQLKREKLEDHLKAIEHFVTQPWAGQEYWKSFISNVFELCHNIRKYVSYLESVNNEMITNHSRSKLTRNLLDNITFEIRYKQKNFNLKFKAISDLLQNSDFYELHLLDNYLPQDKKARYEFINELQVNCTFTLYRYYHGNYLGTLNFIWKIPDLISEQDKSQEAQMLTLANEMIPSYFTRQMRKNATEKYSLIAKMAPSITPAVHDRYSTSVLYLPIAMSIADLKNIIIKKLEKKYGTPLNSEIYIPSNEYIRLQFWPGIVTANAASKYTGRFEIKYKVQSRQLSKFHADAHYCAALFRYMRLFAIKYRNYCSLICADDKHKVPIGEGIGQLVVGQVYVSYKNTVFQPSSALRHSTEFYKNILRQYDGNIPEILLLYTDGGPDHRNTFGSVQIALICLFLRGNFDFLASIRTASYHSWMNPAERVMSILNLALQGVSLQRDPMNDILEDIFKGKNTLEEIRSVAQENKKLGLELRKSIKIVQELLSKQTKRLKINENNFQIYTPASLINIDETFEAIHHIDSTLQQEETFMNSLNKHQELQNFMKSHCQIRTYSFQIKKCGDDECKFCLPIRLPKEIFDELKFIPDPMLSTDLEHYQDFDKLYGTKTREYLPSASGSMKENIPVGIINNSNIRKLVNCTVCNKPRCIFSKNALSDEEKTSLEILLDNVIYICGSPITPEMHDLYKKVYVRQKIYCNSPIEAVYYSCHRLKIEIICFYCGDENELLEPDDNLKKKFTTIYPFC
ncbi:hypothetical protein RclHR1_03550015 [Rhizophagus clarus]|uniref:Uncharacterized protein n=1 Tax=Rhizophagus clarus TaxID=94130 RepID=A0A2Z6RAW7_9GLOM|nr:hypothetical protein RclHR1_03550015 [Rhizophagus clarus]